MGAFCLPQSRILSGGPDLAGLRGRALPLNILLLISP